MLPPDAAIVDLNLELDPKNFAMRTPAGFSKDMQFAMQVIKEHDAPGGAGQIVRGVHMRLHAGSHIDAPEHNVRGGTQVHEFLQDGSLRALGVGADEPIAEPVMIPTAISQGIDYRYTTWYGILAPAKTPAAARKRLADAIVKAGEDPGLRKKMEAQGIVPRSRTLEAFDAYVDADVKRLAPLTVGLAK